jgi:hypothetical protein
VERPVWQQLGTGTGDGKINRPPPPYVSPQAVAKDARITDLRLDFKSGGKSGTFERGGGGEEGGGTAA